MIVNLLLLITLMFSVWIFYWSVLVEKDEKANIKKFPFAPRFLENKKTSENVAGKDRESTNSK